MARFQMTPLDPSPGRCSRRVRPGGGLRQPRTRWTDQSTSWHDILLLCKARLLVSRFIDGTDKRGVGGSAVGGGLQDRFHLMDYWL